MSLQSARGERSLAQHLADMIEDRNGLGHDVGGRTAAQHEAPLGHGLC